MKKHRIGVYPGSFDPVTFGHIDVVERSLAFLDSVTVAVVRNPRKQCLFALEERAGLLRKIFRGRADVSVDVFEGLLIDYLERRKTTIIIRGLRAVSDFEYEFQMALTNRKLNADVETVFLMPREEYFYTSSSMVKELAALGGDLSRFVPPAVERALRRTVSNRRRT